MAGILFGGGVAGMSGSEGGTTYARNKGGAYTRQRVKPTNPRTASQQNQRSIMTQVSAAWSNILTQAQRDGWNTFALSYPVPGRFGLMNVLSGSQMFNRLNSRLLAASLARIDDAPVNQDVTDLVTAELTADIGAGGFVLDFTPTPIDGDDVIVVRATPGLSPGISNGQNQLRTVAVSGLGEASGWDFRDLYLATFGSLPLAGQKIISEVHVLRSTNGAVDAPLRADAIVVDT